MELPSMICVGSLHRVPRDVGLVEDTVEGSSMPVGMEQC